MSGGSHFLRGGFFSGRNWFNPPCGNFCRRETSCCENILRYPARRSRGGNTKRGGRSAPRGESHSRQCCRGGVGTLPLALGGRGRKKLRMGELQDRQRRSAAKERAAIGVLRNHFNYP